MNRSMAGQPHGPGRKLKKPASGVLASFRPSTYPHTGKELFQQLGVGRVIILRLRSSLPAALLDGLFEHPAGVFPFILDT